MFNPSSPCYKSLVAMNSAIMDPESVEMNPNALKWKNTSINPNALTWQNLIIILN